MLYRYKRPKCLAVLCVLLLAAQLLSGCGRPSATPEEVLRAICNTEKPLPAGRLYVLSAPQDDDRHPGEDLLATSFGNGSYPAEMGEVEDAAFYFSLTHPCEFSVFLCKSADGTDAVARMCLRRLDYLKTYRTDGDEAVYTKNAAVTVRGRWVILCVSSDPEGALRAFRQTL